VTIADSPRSGSFVRITGDGVVYNFVTKQDGSVQVYIPPGDYSVEVIYVDESGDEDVVYTGTSVLTNLSFDSESIDVALTAVP
jgi:hypothetical protein